MKSNFFTLTLPSEQSDSIPDSARHCLDLFSEAFNQEDRQGMDSQCHFPHYLIGETSVIIWNESGQIPEQFFTELKQTGWAFTTAEKCQPVLVTRSKLHIIWSYARRKADGSVISLHENLWILQKKDDRWGIVVRSY